MSVRSALPIVLVVLIVIVSFGVAADTEKSPPAPPASSYAPAADLLNQVDYYVKHIEEALADKSEFDDAAKNRLAKDGNTLAALFLVLELHDSQNRLQHRGSNIIPAAQALAKSSDYDTAKKHLEALKGKMAEGGIVTGNPPLSAWRTVASLDQLMKQVPTVNSALKRAVTPQRFKSMQQQSAGQSATLAAIAQAVTADTSAVKTSTDLDKWYEYCTEMRTAAGAVNFAIHAQDEAATIVAMSRLAASCETCHKVFRKE